MSFSKSILNWYHKNKRDLPWRHTREPYKIWLSEIIMQQTRVEQGLPYYEKFVEHFPSVKALAKAPEATVMKLWQGLGYYSRARNLHAAAKDIQKRFDGKFPKTYEEILSLKGIGEYTAAAIASFAYDLPYPVVDGNVFRILSRYFGISEPIEKPTTKKQFTTLAGELMTGFPPHDFNQAIMEFGARQCKPVNPDCGVCPLRESCFAYSNGVISELPVKEKKTKVRNRYFHYLVISSEKHFYIRKRGAKDIWEGLHDFPLIETAKAIKPEKLIASADWKKMISSKAIVETISSEYKHLLSHQHIYTRFYHITEKSLKLTLKEKGKLIKVNTTTFKKYAVPRVIDRYLEEKKKRSIKAKKI